MKKYEEPSGVKKGFVFNRPRITETYHPPKTNKTKLIFLILLTIIVLFFGYMIVENIILNDGKTYTEVKT